MDLLGTCHFLPPPIKLIGSEMYFSASLIKYLKNLISCARKPHDFLTLHRIIISVNMNVNTGLSSSLLLLREPWFETPKGKNSFKGSHSISFTHGKYLI